MVRSLRSIRSSALLLAGISLLIPGASAGNDASGVTLLANLPFDEMPGENVEANDVYGYTSPSGREYALCGMRKGLAFLEITNPTSPVVVDYTTNEESLWGDMCTMGSYAYKVNETANGIQVIDMTNIDAGSVSLITEVFDGPQTNSHNIQSNTESGYIYTLGSDNFGGGVMAFDASDPSSPVFAGGWDESYCHDAMIVSYPSGPFAGREICFVAGGSNGVYIVDVTDKSNMFTVSSFTYTGLAYCHQLWVDDERKYLYLDDELDELVENVTSTTTYMFDVSDLNNPFFVQDFTNGLPCTDHNMWGRDGFLFEANYESGLRVYDIRDPGTISEVAYFDTYPLSNEVGFAGAWGVFTDFPSGCVVVSDRVTGFWVLDPSPTTDVGLPEDAVRLDLEAYPNPFTRSTRMSFDLEAPAAVRLDIVDVSGREVDRVFGGDLGPGNHRLLWSPSDVRNGVYFAVLRAGTETRTGRIVLNR